jgi:hypothetical protein
MLFSTNGASLIWFIFHLFQTDDDWIFFSEIFKHHKPILLEYQALHILKNGFKSGKWIEEEIAMLKTLIKFILLIFVAKDARICGMMLLETST